MGAEAGRRVGRGRRCLCMRLSCLGLFLSKAAWLLVFLGTAGAFSRLEIVSLVHMVLIV